MGFSVLTTAGWPRNGVANAAQGRRAERPAVHGPRGLNVLAASSAPELGAQAAIRKPFDLDLVLDTLRGLLASSPAADP